MTAQSDAGWELHPDGQHISVPVAATDPLWRPRRR